MMEQKGTIKNIKEDNKKGTIIGYDKKTYYFDFDDYENAKKNPKAKELVKFEIRKKENPKDQNHAIKIKKIHNLTLIKYFKKNVLKIDENKYDEFCDTVRDYAEILKNYNVTTSQIRNIYSRIMNSNNIKDLKILRPRFAYISGRNEKNHTLRDFMELLDYLVKKMSKKEEMENFKKFMEAIVAYRKYVGKDQ